MKNTSQNPSLVKTPNVNLLKAPLLKESTSEKRVTDSIRVVLSTQQKPSEALPSSTPQGGFPRAMAPKLWALFVKGQTTDMSFSL